MFQNQRLWRSIAVKYLHCRCLELTPVRVLSRRLFSTLYATFYIVREDPVPRDLVRWVTVFLISFSPRRVPVSELSINRLERLSESPGGGTVRSVLNNLGFPAYKVTSQSAYFRYSRAVLCKAIFQCILSEIRPPHRRCLTVGPAKSPLLGSLSKGAFERRTSLRL